MARKKRTNEDGCYVNNKELRELVIKYNDLNPNDDGTWLLRFEKTMKSKGKWDKVKDWVEMRKSKYRNRKDEYPAEFLRVSELLFHHVYEIIRRRVACFSGIPFEEREDVIQDCALAVTQYINRYREDLNSSAFAYITEIINNAIKLHMGKDLDSRWCRCSWNEISNECMALMYGMEENIEE